MPKTHGQLLQDLASILADYREGEIPPRTPDVINAWLQQFPRECRDPLLGALIHVFSKTYISKKVFHRFLTRLATTNKLCPAASPAAYWKKVNFLNIQQGGSSQKDILSAFDLLLQKAHGFPLSKTGSKDGDHVYLDDCIGTGNRARNDVCSWIASDAAPKKVTLHIITPILYSGAWWINGKIQEAANKAGKSVVMHQWRLDCFAMENRLAHRNESDVLWPTCIPEDPRTRAYAKQLENLGHPTQLRVPGSAGQSGIFADDTQKQLLEQLFLVRGCHIRAECANLPDTARPLGYQKLDGLGFGSMFVTYRNCPNNCPLAFWVDQRQYPALFPRKTNKQTTGGNLPGLFDL